MPFEPLTPSFLHMSRISIDDFDRSTFGKLSLSYGIPLIIVLVLWYFLLSNIFEWRPFRFSKPIIINWLQKPSNSLIVNTVYGLWWLLFVLPFLVCFLYGYSVYSQIKPPILGIVIGVAPSSFLLIILSIMNYYKNGFRLTNSVIITISSSIVLIYGLTASIVFMMDPQSWMSYGFLLVWPSLLVYAIGVCASRRRLKDESANRILESENSLNCFIDDLSRHDYGQWIQGNGKFGWIWAFIVILSSLTFNGVFYLVWKDKPQRTATIGTVGSSILVDFLLILSQFSTVSHRQTMFILFLGYVVKTASVAFSSRFWFVGHGIMFMILGSFFLSRFLNWLFITLMNETNRGKSELSVVTLPPQIEAKLNELQPRRNSPEKHEAFLSLGAFLVFFVSIIIEFISFDTQNLEVISQSISQHNAVISLIIFAFSIAFVVNSIVSLYENNNQLSNSILLSYFIGLIIFLFQVFFMNNLGSLSKYRTIIIFTIISLHTSAIIFLVYHGNNFVLWTSGSFFGSKNDTFLSLLIIIDVISFIFVIIYPLFNSIVNGYIGVLVMLFIISTLLYIAFVLSFRQNQYIHRFEGLLILSYCITVVFEFVLLYQITSGIGLSVAIIGCFAFICLLTFLYIWFILNNRELTQAQFVTWLTSSAVIVVSSIFIYFQTDYKFVTANVFLFSSFMMLFSTIYYFGQKGGWNTSPFSWGLSISFIILFLVTVLHLYSQVKSTFIVTTTFFVVSFLVSMIIVLALLYSGSKTNVVVFTNIFFPVRQYYNGSLSDMKVFTFFFIMFFISPWTWGLFASVFFIHPQFGAMSTSAAFSFISFLVLSLLYNFDSYTLDSLNFMHKEIIEFAIRKSMKSANVRIEETHEMKNYSTFDEFIKFSHNESVSYQSKSEFISALKAQFYITSEVAFESAKAEIIRYLSGMKIQTHSLQNHKKFNSFERIKVFELRNEIDLIDISSKKDQSYYEKYVRQQQEERARKTLELINESRNINQEFSSLYQLLRSRGQKYQDSEFHPHKAIAEENPELMSDISWTYGDQLYGNEIIGKTTPYDICQGKIGDCYFVAAMSAISTYPSFIEKIFDSPVDSQCGAACVGFNIMGKRVSVIVDTQIPVRMNRPKFVSPKKSPTPWWFIIVEKAYAKQNGSYSAIEGGNSHDALYRMIGGWPEVFHLESLEMKEQISNGSLWKSMLEWNNNDEFLCCGSHSGKDTSRNKSNIVLGHAYSIHRVVEIKGYKLMQLRNPWGDMEWNGDWSDGSPLWNRYPEIARDLGHSEVDDGVFWMSFDDFVRNYSSLYVCLTHKRGNWFSKEIWNSLLPGPLDGSKPVTNSPDATNLPQYLLRLSKPCMVRVTFEKAGNEIPCWVYAVYNQGKAVKKIYAGDVYKSEGISSNQSLQSFTWKFDQVTDPWTIIVCRNSLSTKTDYYMKFWADCTFELSELAINSSRNENI